MTKSEHIKNLLQRFIKNTISKSEFEELFGYLHEIDVEEDVKDSMKQHWEKINADLTNDALKPSDNDQLLEAVLEKIDLKKSPEKSSAITTKHIYKRYAIAATITLFFGIGMGYLYYTNFINSNSKSAPEIPAEVITLQLDNGDVKIISDKESEQIVNAKGLVVGTRTGNSIAYTNNISEEKLAYNTLTVPYGKRFQVVLSDGTKVHLNAGTSLRYPIKFLNGLNREVFLDGEAYFDVVKDAKHPFLVNAKDLNIKVLGTRFNITSYPENEMINTILVEGAVEVFEKDKDTEAPLVLKPGYKASWHKQHKNINVEKVNIEQYVAWMNGRLILNEVPFEAIQKKLQRQYNVTFINNNEALKSRKFTGRFDIESIDQVMKSLSISASFNYVLNNNQIIIN
ncbi:FecR family protein [Flavivirga eckloniae]|nr:FecR domain-containing protein [Flavivirga eckloniae]